MNVCEVTHNELPKSKNEWLYITNFSSQCNHGDSVPTIPRSSKQDWMEGLSFISLGSAGGDTGERVLLFSRFSLLYGCLKISFKVWRGGGKHIHEGGLRCLCRAPWNSVRPDEGIRGHICGSDCKIRFCKTNAKTTGFYFFGLLKTETLSHQFLQVKYIPSETFYRS